MFDTEVAHLGNIKEEFEADLTKLIKIYRSIYEDTKTLSNILGFEFTGSFGDKIGNLFEIALEYLFDKYNISEHNREWISQSVFVNVDESVKPLVQSISDELFAF